jgi:hypothetical protein
MRRSILCLLAPIVVAALVLNLPAAQRASAQPGRFDQFSVLPFNELQPGFTTLPRQEFTLDLAGVGREPIKVVSIAINGRTLPREAWRVQLGELRITPNRDLRQGLNGVTIRYEHPTDARHRRTDNPVVHTFFVAHQLHRAAVQLGNRGELVVEGTPRFIRGAFRSGQVDEFLEALPSAAAAGFNMVHDYRFETYDVRQLGLERFITDARAYLRRAHELQMGVFLGLPRQSVGQYEEQTLATIIAELGNEPGLWMWYIYDEPYEDVLTVETASRVYELLRRLDPLRPSVMLTNRVKALQEYHPFCDVLWFDRYPILATSEQLTSLAPIVAALQKARLTVAPGKPVWPVLQLHDNKGRASVRKRSPLLPKVSDATHRPGEAEIRAQAHLAIAQQSPALVYYWAPQSWYSMRTDTPKIWQSLTRVLHELRDLEPVLLSRARPPALKVSGGHDKVMMWTREYEGRTYVGLVNASIHTPARLAIHVPTGGRQVQRLYGDGQVGITADRIEVRLGSAGVVVLAFQSR